ncbi:MAG: phage tail tip lysozyme [Xanthobacteraceae bacterium]
MSAMAYATSQHGAGPHLTPTNPDGSDKTPTEYLLDASRWYTEYSARRNPAEATVLMERNGMPQGMINLLSLGPTELQKRLKEGEKFAPSADDVKKFQDLQVEMGKASMAAEKLGRSIALLLTPGLIKFMESVNRIVEAFVKGGWIEGFKAIDDEASAGVGEAAKAAGVDASGIGEKANQGWWGRFKSRFKWHNPLGGREETVAPMSGDGPTGASVPSPASAPAAAMPGTGRSEGPLPRGTQSRASIAKAYFVDQLRQEGVPEANLNTAASLLAGQAIAESNLNPNLSHDGGTGYGIYGARLGRRSRMFAWLRDNGYERNSLEGQARYMAYEAMNDPTYRPSRNALMTATPNTMAYATRVLTGNFERPAVDNSPHRHRAAQGVLTLPMPQRQRPAATAPEARSFDDLWNDRADPLLEASRLSQLGARAAVNNRTSTTTTTNNRSATFGDINVTVPPGANPAEYANGIRQELQRYSPVMNANEGLL